MAISKPANPKTVDSHQFLPTPGPRSPSLWGCFSFQAWLRLNKSIWWLVPGSVSLALFALLLTLVGSDAAGLIYAAYGSVYIVASLLWL